MHVKGANSKSDAICEHLGRVAIASRHCVRIDVKRCRRSCVGEPGRDNDNWDTCLPAWSISVAIKWRRSCSRKCDRPASRRQRIKGSSAGFVGQLAQGSDGAMPALSSMIIVMKLSGS